MAADWGQKLRFSGLTVHIEPPSPERQVPILDLIDAFTALYPDEEYGFAHIVLSDYNLDDTFLDYCLNETDILPHNPVTVKFLEFLRAIPEDVRCGEDEQA